MLYSYPIICNTNRDLLGNAGIYGYIYLRLFFCHYSIYILIALISVHIAYIVYIASMARMAYVAMAWPRSVPYNYRFKYVSIYVCAVMCCCAWSIIERAATATLNQIYIYIYIYIYIHFMQQISPNACQAWVARLYEIISARSRKLHHEQDEATG